MGFFFFWSSLKKALAFWPKTAIWFFLISWGTNSVLSLPEEAWTSRGSSHQPFFEGWLSLAGLGGWTAATVAGLVSATTGTAMEAPDHPAKPPGAGWDSANWLFVSSQAKTCSALARSFTNSFEEHHISFPLNLAKTWGAAAS